jgi:hypothetical protein
MEEGRREEVFRSFTAITLPGMILFSAGWKGFDGTSAPNDQFDLRSSGPLRYGIVVGMDMRDSGVHNYPPRWNAAPSQELLVIRRNHDTGVVSLDPLRRRYPATIELRVHRAGFPPSLFLRDLRRGHEQK